MHGFRQAKCPRVSWLSLHREAATQLPNERDVNVEADKKENPEKEIKEGVH